MINVYDGNNDNHELLTFLNIMGMAMLKVIKFP